MCAAGQGEVGRPRGGTAVNTLALWHTQWWACAAGHGGQARAVGWKVGGQGMVLHATDI